MRELWMIGVAGALGVIGGSLRCCFRLGLSGSALRLDQPFDLVKHVVGIGRQFRKFVAVPRTRHARFDMTGTDRGEGGVHGLHPIA